MKVFCRLKPIDVEATLCKAVSSNSVAIFPRKPQQQPIKYIFNEVFDGEATQERVFECVALPLVKEVLLGISGLLFTYGVTGSGKTFTMSESGGENAGIIPRCLDTIFNNVKGRQVQKDTFKSNAHNQFFICKMAQSTRTRDFIGVNKVCNTGRLYAIFVSYIEIYNDLIFDLLEECCRSLQVKRIREAGNVYIQGLTEIEVTSIEEAMEVFQRGHRRKHMAYTRLNTTSSRSHSVFTIRVVQAPEEMVSKTSRVVEVLGVSQLSLVDLAGNERLKRTQNSGDRLKEAGKINSSILTLKTCLDLLRRKSKRGSAKEKIPYRNSKLTHLFKNYFEGQGLVSMMVCINPHDDCFQENIHVLKFGEECQEVQVAQPTPKVVTCKSLFPKTPEQVFRPINFSAVYQSPSELRKKKEPLLQQFKELPDLIKMKDIDDMECLPNLIKYLEKNLDEFNQDVIAFNKKKDILKDKLLTELTGNLQTLALRGILDEEDQYQYQNIKKEDCTDEIKNEILNKVEMISERVKKSKEWARALRPNQAGPSPFRPRSKEEFGKENEQPTCSHWLRSPAHSLPKNFEKKTDKKRGGPFSPGNRL